MLSGNGRHRRPRQAPALLVTVGVTGSAVAIPLLGAGAASAADGSAWDRVAKCETGGSWSQNSGNGYYGGLQLTQEDWEAYGGLDYATGADQASRGQQIAVAERIFADRGFDAWRACGLSGGLDQDPLASGADTDAGVGEGSFGASGASGSERSAAPSPSRSVGPSSDAGGPESDAGESGEEAADGREAGEAVETSLSARSDGADQSGQKAGASEEAAGDDSGNGRHRGVGAEEGAGGDAGTGSSGRHVSRGGLGFGGPSPSSDPGVGSASGSSTAPGSFALGGGWLAQYGGGDGAAGEAAPASPLFGQ